MGAARTSAQLLVFVEVLQLLEVFVVEIVVVQIVLVIQVLVLLLIVVEGKPIVFELIVVVVKLPTQIRGFHRRLPGRHDDVLRHQRECHDASATRAARAAFLRSFAGKTRLRSRMFFGVTSMSSSSSMYSRAYSSVISRGGSRMMFSSDAVVRMLVSFFSFVTFTSRSPGRELSPAIIPSYTRSPGATNIWARSWRLPSAKATTEPSRSATSTPRFRPASGPAHGP